MKQDDLKFLITSWQCYYNEIVTYPTFFSLKLPNAPFCRPQFNDG